MTKNHFWLVLFLLGVFPNLAKATPTTIFQKIQTYDQLILTTNLDSLAINKREAPYQSAHLVLKADNQPDLALDISIRARGKFRRKTCEFPPIKLNFAKSDLKSMGLVKNFDKLKLVTHCQAGNDYEQHLLKEYWAYRMYNVVTEDSYRVKLLKIRYVHEPDAKRFIDSYAIILESPYELAERLGGAILPQKYGMTTTDVTTASFDQTIFFNFMIGNTDWALHVQRNLTLIQKEGEKRYTIIPYDFDQSKLVNAPYLAKHPSLKEVKADHRHAMGAISSELALQQLSKDFKQKKSAFKAYKTCPHLKKKIKGEITAYLYSFYLELGDKAGLRSEFLAVR